MVSERRAGLAGGTDEERAELTAATVVVKRIIDEGHRPDEAARQTGISHPALPEQALAPAPPKAPPTIGRYAKHSTSALQDLLCDYPEDVTRLRDIKIELQKRDNAQAARLLEKVIKALQSLEPSE